VCSYIWGSNFKPRGTSRDYSVYFIVSTNHRNLYKSSDYSAIWYHMLSCDFHVSIDKIDFSAKFLQVRFKTKARTASCYAARALQWHLRSITSQGSSPRGPGPQGSFISCLFSPEPVSKMKAELLEWNCVWAFLELSCFLTLGTREDWVLHCVGVRSPFPGPRIMPRAHEGQSLSRRNFWLLLTSISVIISL
jgi:hypothetical protein